MDVLGEPAVAYREKAAAEFACKEKENMIVPCTITYTIPKKSHD